MGIKVDFNHVVSDACRNNQKQRVELLQSVKVFHGLFQDELYAVAECAIDMVFSQGEDIVKQDEESDVCFVLLDGECSIRKDGKECDRRRVASKADKRAEVF